MGVCWNLTGRTLGMEFLLSSILRAKNVYLQLLSDDKGRGEDSVGLQLQARGW